MSTTLTENIQHARSSTKGLYLPSIHSFHDLLLNHLAERSPDDLFMIYYDVESKRSSITYHEFIRKVRQTAAYFNMLLHGS
jgi:acyl-coenzyme A synthetase/AMP-(fatty) acid ligase